MGVSGIIGRQLHVNLLCQHAHSIGSILGLAIDLLAKCDHCVGSYNQQIAIAACAAQATEYLLCLAQGSGFNVLGELLEVIQIEVFLECRGTQFCIQAL